MNKPNQTEANRNAEKRGGAPGRVEGWVEGRTGVESMYVDGQKLNCWW